MHFSIPDTQLFNVNGSSYMGYNIHINGAFHCVLRFRQLHCLHEQLRKEFPNRLPSFPPKKLLPLSQSQLEDRRTQLERYLQLVGQDAAVSGGPLLNCFLLAAQQESARVDTHRATLDVHLPDGARRTLTAPAHTNNSCSATAAARWWWSSPRALRQLVCGELGLPEEHADRFALYLARVVPAPAAGDVSVGGDLELVRRLQAFEAPHLSLRLCSIDCGVYLRRSRWDPVMDERMLRSEDHAHHNGGGGGWGPGHGLLYAQAVADVERGWLRTGATAAATGGGRGQRDGGGDVRKRLDELREAGDKRQYLELARSLPGYGTIRFLPCPCDYTRPPQPHNDNNTTGSPSNNAAAAAATSAGPGPASMTDGGGGNWSMCRMSIGPRAITLTPVAAIGGAGADTMSPQRVNNDDSSSRYYCWTFPVTRVRCWRLTTVHGNDGTGDVSPTFSSDSTSTSDYSSSNTTNNTSSSSSSSSSTTPCSSPGNTKINKLLGDHHGNTDTTATTAMTQQQHQQQQKQRNHHGNSNNSTVVSNNTHYSQPQHQQCHRTRLEFSFEYLVAKDDLRWITLQSEQAALMSCSLQSVVDELVLKRENDYYSGTLGKRLSDTSLHTNDDGIGGSGKHSQTEHDNNASGVMNNWSYMSRDGASVRFRDQTTAAVNNVPSDNTISTAGGHESLIKNGRRRTSQNEYRGGGVGAGGNGCGGRCGNTGGSGNTGGVKAPGLFANAAAGDETMQNGAFEEIGDDDL